MQAEILGIARDIAAGMAYLHARNVCHGDLKCENVLLSKLASTEGEDGQQQQRDPAAAAAGSSGSLPTAKVCAGVGFPRDCWFRVRAWGLLCLGFP